MVVGGDTNNGFARGECRWLYQLIALFITLISKAFIPATNPLTHPLLINMHLEIVSTSFQRRALISIIPILFFSLLQAQKIDYCPYFYLDISTREENGESVKSYSPEIDTTHQDSLSTFFGQHYNRFSYLLWNKLGDLGPIAETYPDTAIMDSLFCDLLRNNSLFLFYLNNVLPESFRLPGSTPETFTTDEMMLVASHFFYCLEIQQSDTVIISHICVSIKDQETIPFKRDMTLLEAFAFEGIFHALQNEEKSKIDANFRRYINESTNRYKDRMNSLEELLVTVRHECFALMEDDEDLKQSLLQYYRDNRDNLNFIID